MRFEARILKPYAEPVPPDQFKESEIYYSIVYLDDDMKIPEIITLVFIGRNLDEGDKNILYFQDVPSYQQGIRYISATVDENIRFFKCAGDQAKHIFEFEQALEQLMACSLRRQNLL